MASPRVVVLDEPTSNLSPALANEVLEAQVRTLADAGAAVLLVEQKAMEALSVGDWAYILVAGLVHLSAPASELLARDDIGELFLGKVLA
jgi:branched-chain amino acid transport system ATP-binding protein